MITVDSQENGPLAIKGRGRPLRGQEIFGLTATDESPMTTIEHPHTTTREPDAAPQIAAIRALAIRYQNGDGIRQHLGRAFKLFQQAAELGDAESEFNVGTYFENGLAGPKDETYAAYCYFRAAKAGSINGTYALGTCFADGIGFPKNDQIAAELFESAAQAGDVEGAYAFGQCLLHGRGVTRNLKVAFHWLLKAADQQFAPAQLSVGLCYLRGEGVRRDANIARQFIAQAAQAGDEVAIKQLAKLSKKKSGSMAE